MKVEYSSNNSGGRWWLEDRHWIMLEEAGWFVEWGKKYFCGSTYSWDKKPEGKPDCGKGKDCQGHRRFDSYREMTDEDRWLGALASYANKEFDSIKVALEEFESITGMSVSDEGCNCCGPPHCFSWNDGYCSGEDCLQYLYENVPGSFCEAVERLNQKN